MKRTLVLHPYLIALFPVLSLYAHNIDKAPLRSALEAMAGSLLMAGILFNLLRIVLKDSRKRGILTSVVLIMFFSYGHIHSLLFEWVCEKASFGAGLREADNLVKYDLSAHIFVLLSLIIVGEMSLVRVFKRDSLVFHITRIMNPVSVALVALPLMNIGVYGLKARKVERWQDEEMSTAVVKADGKKPDIYYIILDAYARADILEEFYGFDNSEFIDYLEAKGFYVASKSCANYPWSFLSLSSSLNFRYINDLADVLGESSRDFRIPSEMIRNNRVANFLKSQGYLFVHINSTWGPTLSNKYADREIGYKKGVFQDEFKRILAGTTVLKLFNPLIVKNLAEIHLNTFRVLESIPDMTEPTFTFTHCVLPHYPYMFDRFGKVNGRPTLGKQFKACRLNDANAYIEQLIFVNKKIRSVVDKIMEKSGVPPIIIMQSDHGPHVPDAGREDFVRARMCNFNAYHLPDGGNQLLYPSITPVNSFRVVFNRYFDTNHELLPDTCYFSQYAKPYGFMDVSGTVKDHLSRGGVGS